MKTIRVVPITVVLFSALSGVALAGDEGAGVPPEGIALDAGLDLSRAYRPGDDEGLLPSAATGSSTLTLAALQPLTQGGVLFKDRSGYLEAKAGPLFFINDFVDMSPGFEIDGAFGFHPISILALEASAGYFWGEDTGGSTDEKLWGIPIEGRAIVEIPLIPLDPYAGIGIGGYYLDTKLSGPGGDEKTDFVFGWNLVLGLRLGLGPLILGVEGKYVQTDVADTAWGSERLQGVAVMGTLGMAF